MGRVFISYAHENKVKALRVGERLKDLGFSTWIDDQNLFANDDISTAIDGQISSVDVVLVLWSNVSRDSVWVRGEALKGLETEKYFGALLDPLTPPVPFNTRSAPDLSEWTGLHQHSGWDRLIRGMAELSSAKLSVLEALNVAQLAEKAEERETQTQEPLPFENDLEALPVGPAYQDVEMLKAAAEGILATAGKLDLSAAIIQAALDEEVLRAAAFVVSLEPQKKAPKPAKCPVLNSIQAAIERARDGDVIAVMPGRYDENIRIKRGVRLVGLGWIDRRPTIAAKFPQHAISFEKSARLENFAIETRQRGAAIHCADGQPIILRCSISKFGDALDNTDAGLYVAGKANPVVMASSITSTGSPAVYQVHASGGTYLGVGVLASRAAAISCRGRPQFRGCNIEAIGGHAVEVRSQGFPSFESCEISGRGATVVRIVDQARPQIKNSRVTAIRQLAFDFDGDATGRYERNIVECENAPEAGTAQKKRSDFFGLLKSKEDRVVSAATSNGVISLRGHAKPLFISNTMANGDAVPLPQS